MVACDVGVHQAHVGGAMERGLVKVVGYDSIVIISSRTVLHLLSGLQAH